MLLFSERKNARLIDPAVHYMTVICNRLLGCQIYILLVLSFRNCAVCDSLCKLCLSDPDVVHILRVYLISEQLVTLDRLACLLPSPKQAKN
jgi:hypothetical protein